MQNVDLIQFPVLTKFVSPKSGITLTVNGGSFGHADEDDVLSGIAKRVEMRASSDGRFFHRGVWHDGPETGESVWVEVWEYSLVEGYDSTPRPVCVFHGCVDSVSRKVTQTG